MSLLPRDSLPNKQRCEKVQPCAASRQRYFLQQDLNAGAGSSTAQCCTSERLQSSLFLFSQLNVIFEMFYPLCCLISAINHAGHVMNGCCSRCLGLGSFHFLAKAFPACMVLQSGHTDASLRSRKPGHKQGSQEALRIFHSCPQRDEETLPSGAKQSS